MDKLLLVDGSNLLFQMFYGMPARIVGKHGKAIHGTVGFIGALLKIIRLTDPTHAAVFFDGEHKNIRTEINADYKANRPDFSQMPEEETPFSQLPDIYAALELLGIAYSETEIGETDDVIASYALTYGSTADVVISSFDSDFFQLITEKISVLRYRGDNTVICTPEYIKNKLGIEPCVYADYKALTGDSSDNIKGAEKVGPKTAAALICEFGDLEGVLNNAENIKKPSVRASVTGAKDRLRENYKLIKLGVCSEMPFRLCELCFAYTGVSSGSVLKTLGIV